MKIGAPEGKDGVVLASSATEPRSAPVAGDRRWKVRLAITVALACSALVILAVTFAVRQTPTARVAHRAMLSAPANASDADTTTNRTRAALAWLDGLEAGRIVPFDVTSRLEAQDPTTAEVVLAAWSDLNSSAGTVRVEKALGWVDGLAAGLIVPSDVTSRLAAQDPTTAKVVLSAWSDLTAAHAEPGSTATDG